MNTPPNSELFSGTALLVILLVGMSYFVPTAVAISRNRKRRDLLEIVFLNLFLGWTVVGWVVALVWAVD